MIIQFNYKYWPQLLKRGNGQTYTTNLETISFHSGLLFAMKTGRYIPTFSIKQTE